MSAVKRSGRVRRLDALAPWSLVTFFWISDLLAPYLYAEMAAPWRRAPDMMGTIDISDVRWAFVAACVYLVVFLAAYFATTWRPRRQFSFREPARPLSPLRHTFVFVAALAVFLVVFIAHPNANFVSRMELTTGVWGKVLFLVIGFLFAAFWLSVTGLLKAEGRGVPLLRVALACTCALAMIIVFAPMEGRARMLMAFLFMLVAWHYFVRPFGLAQAWSILAAGLLIAIALDYARLTQHYAELDVFEMAYGLAYGRQFDGILNLSVTMNAVSAGNVGHHFGAAWLADIGKDLGLNLGTDSRSLFMGDVLRMPNYQAGFPLTRPGELFLAFGWPGIVVGAAILGVFSRVWYNWLVLTRPFGDASIAVYFTFLLTASVVTQKNYMFSSLVMASVYAALILILALALYGYRLSWTTTNASALPARGRRTTA